MVRSVSRRVFLIASAAAVAGCETTPVGSTAPVPGKSWGTAAPPHPSATAGLVAPLSTLDTTALVAVHGGHVSIATARNAVFRTWPPPARAWCRCCTDDGLAYGYLWWIFDPSGPWPAAMQGGYTASGAFGQFITVLPRLDLVIAHKTQAPSQLNVPPERYFGGVVPAVMQLALRGRMLT